jgi:AraC-like DNA-binding protein
MDLPGVEMTVSSIESVVAASVARIRFWAGPEWVPREVWFRHAEPGHSEAYRRFFRCDVRFGAPAIAVVIAASMMDEKNMTDSSISTLIERRAEAALDELAEEASFASRVRDQILRSLGTESVGAEAVCRRLHVSRATLTRKLAQEQTTLSDVLSDVRRDLAIEYLRDGHLSVEEIARRLAFSDARAFRRAFQRWTGSSPADFRAK